MASATFTSLLSTQVFSPAHAIVPVREPVLALAASEAGVVALTRTEVRLLDAAGFPVRRLGLNDPLAGKRRRRKAHRDGFAAAAGVLDDGEFNDPSDPDSDIEDPENILVEDEVVRQRHAQEGEPLSEAGLAAGGRVAWIGRADGLWRVDADGNAGALAISAGGGAIRKVAASPSGSWVAAASDHQLFRSRDGGDTFDAVLSLIGPVRSLAVTPPGSVFVIDGLGLRRLRSNDAEAQLIEPSGATEVTACGTQAVARAGQWLFTIGEGSDLDGVFDRRAAPPETERVACSADGSLWLGFQPALWMSLDQGQSWSSRSDLQPLPTTSIAITSGWVWVGGSAGLLGLRRDLAREPPEPPEPRQLPREDVGPANCPPRSWRWWMSALPRIDIGFAVARSLSRRDVRAFFLLTFLLAGHPAWASDSHRLATEQAWRQRNEQLAPAVEGGPGELTFIDLDGRNDTFGGVRGDWP